MASNQKPYIGFLQLLTITIGISLGIAPLITGIFGEQKGLLRLLGVHLHDPYTFIIPTLVTIGSFGFLIFLDKLEKKS